MWWVPPHPTPVPRGLAAAVPELGAVQGCFLSVPFTRSCVIHRVGWWPREESREEAEQRADQHVPRAEIPPVTGDHKVGDSSLFRVSFAATSCLI